MTNDYLWDKSTPVDAEVAELEQLLAGFGAAAGDPAWLDHLSPPRATSRPGARFLATAAVLVLACGTFLSRLPADHSTAWPVVRVVGAPRVGGALVRDAARLARGQWLETDASSRASVAVGGIGRLDVEPGTRLRVVESRDGLHHVAMLHGIIHAQIWAAPGDFVVDTPSSRAVDLGCIYTLTVHPDGSGTIEVDAGWVAFEDAGRESFIPAGAVCGMRPRLGPGIPYMEDAPAPLVSGVGVLDADEAPPAGRRGALAHILAAARPDDALTVWHLLERVSPADRDAVFDALARLVPAPTGVTRAGIRAGDRTMLELWWNALGLGDADVWRTWKRQWPSR